MATLHITKVTCLRKQDVTGVDEAEIWLDGHLKWGNTMQKNQSRELSLNQDFVDVIAVEVKERNPNSAKSLGTRNVEASNPVSDRSISKLPEPITRSPTTSPEAE